MEKYYYGLGEFSIHTRFEVGDVAKIRLWHDKWYGGQDLKDIFRDLYNIACVKDASVAGYLEFFFFG